MYKEFMTEFNIPKACFNEHERYLLFEGLIEDQGMNPDLRKIIELLDDAGYGIKKYLGNYDDFMREIRESLAFFDEVCSLMQSIDPGYMLGTTTKDPFYSLEYSMKSGKAGTKGTDNRLIDLILTRLDKSFALIPLGFTKHVIGCYIKKETTNQYSVYIINTGSGISYHPTESVGGRNLVEGIIMKRMDIKHLRAFLTSGRCWHFCRWISNSF